MFGKQSQSMGHTNTSGETVIAQGVRVEGEFRSSGDVVIDGELNGSLETASSLHVGESAVIKAEVSAKSAVIAGTVIGNILATDSLELLASSHVSGDIQTGRISIAAGAVVNGRISMGKAE